MYLLTEKFRIQTFRSFSTNECEEPMNRGATLGTWGIDTTVHLYSYSIQVDYGGCGSEPHFSFEFQWIKF